MRNYDEPRRSRSARADERGCGARLARRFLGRLARHVRSASRYAFVPGFRFDVYVGFRCARVQDGAEPAETRRIRRAERRIAASPSGEAAARFFMPAPRAPQFFRAAAPSSSAAIASGSLSRL